MFTSAHTPALLALFAAALLGGALIVVRNGLRHLSPPAGAVVNISTTAGFFWALSPFFLDWRGWHSPAVWVFVAVGFFHPVMSTMLAFEAVRRMGATVSGIITATAPLFATLAAVGFLRERLTLPVAVGTLGIVAGVGVLSWSPAGRKRDWALILILLPLAAAVVRGATQAGTKFGLNLFPSPLLAGIVSYSISFFSVRVAARILNGGKAPSYTRTGVLWFMVAGAMNGTAILSLYTALGTGQVVVVAPIVATFPLFTVAYTVLFFRQEKITRRILLGALLVVAGVAVLSR